MTGHCPHCGEPVMLVPISTLVAGELQACPCDAEPEPIGPEDSSLDRHPSRFTDPIQWADVERAAGLDGPLDETHLRARREYSARSAGETNAASTSNR